MPKGPRGEKRPADAIGRAIKIAKIATGEIEDERDELSSAAAELGRKGGKKRAATMWPEDCQVNQVRVHRCLSQALSEQMHRLVRS